MILTEKNIKEHKIEKVIGKPIKIDWKKPKAIGSSSFFLQSFTKKNNSNEFIKEYSKCIFQKYYKGIRLRSNLSNRQTVLAIKKTDIINVKLTRGKEYLSPIILSPMWILLKLGVSKITARYFKVRLSEYSIDEMKLRIEN